MSELFSGPESAQQIVVATIANQKNPAQVVEIVHLLEKGVLITHGISTHFNLKEIAIPQNVMLPAIHEMTEVLSYILERIATADDLKIPFRYDPEFELGDKRYILQEGEDFMILGPKE
ncbi:MAG: hypothetical protein LJE89_07960 [Deltaproteobacteria bacterium]|nr:hypothetical protein [Deltaproteobacteria bacterium]